MTKNIRKNLLQVCFDNPRAAAVMFGAVLIIALAISGGLYYLYGYLSVVAMRLMLALGTAIAPLALYGCYRFGQGTVTNFVAGWKEATDKKQTDAFEMADRMTPTKATHTKVIREARRDPLMATQVTSIPVQMPQVQRMHIAGGDEDQLLI